MMVLGTKFTTSLAWERFGKGKSRIKPKSVVFNSVELTLLPIFWANAKEETAKC